ncbi:hypothetical protein ACNHKD_14910 [Methylocystis sp. JAN1]|uniref:hypothetical protein n=1 Tax=Methylocystis sp. JAN1 TaxID=3397211 RepID=UPI003FA1C1D0
MGVDRADFTDALEFYGDSSNRLLANHRTHATLIPGHASYLAIWNSKMGTSKKEATAKTTIRVRTDGRKSLLVYLDADLIKELKKVALDDERNAYEIVEDAVRSWLAQRRTKKRTLK